MTERPDRPAWLMGPAALARIPLPEPPAEPTPAEAEQLIARLNGPEGDRVELNAAQVTYLSTRPPVRYVESVERLRAALDRADDGSPFYAGVRAALDYTQGQAPLGPLSRRRPQGSVPTQGDLGWEIRVAMDAIDGDLDEALPYPRDFIVAVEHTCLWLRGSASEPPVSM